MSSTVAIIPNSSALAAFVANKFEGGKMWEIDRIVQVDGMIIDIVKEPIADPKFITLRPFCRQSALIASRN